MIVSILGFTSSLIFKETIMWTLKTQNLFSKETLPQLLDKRSFSHTFLCNRSIYSFVKKFTVSKVHCTLKYIKVIKTQIQIK